MTSFFVLLKPIQTRLKKQSKTIMLRKLSRERDVPAILTPNDGNEVSWSRKAKLVVYFNFVFSRKKETRGQSLYLLFV